MGNASSLTEGGSGEKQGEILLDGIMKEVEEVSGTLLVIVQSIKQHKQQHKQTNNKAAKEMLEELLSNAFDKLNLYFTTDVHTTRQERNDQRRTLLDTFNITGKGSQLLKRVGLSDADIKMAQEAQVQVKNRSSINFKHLEQQVEKQRVLSRSGSADNSSYQQKPPSEKGRDNDGQQNLTVRKKPGTFTESEVKRTRLPRDTAGKYVEKDEPMNTTVRIGDGNSPIKEGTKYQSVIGNTENLKLTGKPRNQKSVDEVAKGTTISITGNQQATNSYGNTFVELNTDEPKVADKNINGRETEDKIGKGQCQIDNEAISKPTEDWTHLDIDEHTSPQAINKTIQDHRKEIGGLKDEVNRLEDELHELKTEHQKLEMNLKQTKQKNNDFENEVAKKNTDIITKLNEVRHLKEENKGLIMRLSKLAGEKLKKDNPNITDLSDPNRPTKLGEIYSELYDNEWTDAYEGLINAGYQETEAIRALSITLKTAYRFCSKNAHDMLRKTEHVAIQLFEECKESQISVRQSMAIPMSRNTRSDNFSRSKLEEQFVERHWKPKQKSRSEQHDARGPNMSREVVKPANMEGEMVKLRKEVSLSMVPVVQQAYLRGKWDKTCIEALKPFIKKCLFLCWMMVVQSPPMVFDKNTEPGAKFNSALYKQYTSSGDVIEYVVWPALLLHEDGSIVCKGVAQPKQNAQE